MKKFLKILIISCAFFMVFGSGSVFSSYLGNDSNKVHAASHTQIHGPYYKSYKGSTLNSSIAKNSPASLNLQAAARKAVLKKYGKINTTKTYKIKWYQQIRYNNGFGGSYTGTIVNVSVTN